MVQRVVRGVVPSSLDDILNMKNDVIDRELVLKGKFEDEIKRLQQAKADAEEKIGTIATLEEAERVLKNADEAAAKSAAESEAVRAKADSIMVAALAREKSLDEKEQSIADRETALAAKAKALADLEAQLDTRDKGFEYKQGMARAELKQEKDALDESKVQYESNVAVLTERERKFNERLEQLKISA